MLFLAVRDEIKREKAIIVSSSALYADLKGYMKPRRLHSRSFALARCACLMIVYHINGYAYAHSGPESPIYETGGFLFGVGSMTYT